jgi:hypothetical protein
MEGDKDGGFLAITEEMDVSNPTNQERDDKNTANHSMELRRFVLAIIGIGTFEFSHALYSYPGGYKESPNAWGEGELPSLSQLVHLYTGVQINFEDLTPF